ncbi:hypothetical protein EKK58_03245 [Candidatus Dependentiae bacterium]|nr:MAG: hypothetical protein EKK58_03245 [Candidatus Dependentiae bacterium]
MKHGKVYKNSYFKIVLFFHILTIHPQEYGPHEYKGSSFLQTRSVCMRQSMLNFLWSQHVNQKNGPIGGIVSMTPFFLKVRNKTYADSYFLPNNKKAILVAGDETDQKTLLQRDVRAEWLGLPGNTQALYTICPSYRQFGFVLSYNQDVKKIVSFDWFSHWQFAVQLPFVLVEHNVHSAQQNNETDQAASVIDAFNNTAWFAQRITSYRSSAGIGDINLCLNSPYFAKDFFIFAAHSGLTIPTAPKGCTTYLFSPVRGNGRRFALFGGVDMQIKLNDVSHVWDSAFFISVESYYHFSTHAQRTFDIKGKPWSRFLLFNRSDDPFHTNIPGVNVLTLNAHIRPQTYGELSFGWRFSSATCHVEFGYNLWGHDSERIKYIDDELLPVFGIAGTAPLISSNASTIATKANDDVKFIPIKLDDLDLLSAVSTSALHHGFHVAIGASKTGNSIDSFFGCGILCEQSHRQGALPQWGGWVKVGFTV